MEGSEANMEGSCGSKEGNAAKMAVMNGVLPTCKEECNFSSW